MSAKVTEEIKELVDSGKVETKSAVVLILSAQAELIGMQEECMNRLVSIGDSIDENDRKLNARMDAVEKRVEVLEDYMKDHPSILWLARFRTRQTALVILLIFVILLVLWGSDVQQAILDLIF